MDKALYEILVYAFTEKELNIRVCKSKRAIEHKYSGSEIPMKYLERIINAAIFPMAIFRYNHVVGVIRIEYDGKDVQAVLFMSHTRKRVVWKTKQKYYLEMTPTTGLHFSPVNMSNKGIREEMRWLVKTASSHFSRGCYVDREAFDNMNENVDYLGLFRT